MQVAEELDPAPEIVVNESKIPPPKWWKNTSTTQGDMLAAWEARNT